MKRYIFNFSLFFILIFPQACLVLAEEKIEYVVTKDKVENAWISENFKDNFSVIIKLNERATKDFSILTENNIGKRLAIICSGKIVVRAVIKTKIDFGIIKVGDWNSFEDANQFLESLMGIIMREK